MSKEIDGFCMLIEFSKSNPDDKHIVFFATYDNILRMAKEYLESKGCSTLAAKVQASILNGDDEYIENADELLEEIHTKANNSSGKYVLSGDVINSSLYFYDIIVDRIVPRDIHFILDREIAINKSDFDKYLEVIIETNWSNPLDQHILAICNHDKLRNIIKNILINKGCIKSSTETQAKLLYDDIDGAGLEKIYKNMKDKKNSVINDVSLRVKSIEMNSFPDNIKKYKK